MMSFGVIGVSVKGGNMPLLESFVLPEATRAQRLIELKTTCKFSEIVALYTCNRAEYYYLTSDRPAGLDCRNDLLDFLLRPGPSVRFEREEVMSLVAFRALRHLYRVASSLDSMVVGESQILGQVKDALATSQAVGVCGPRLGNIFSDAFRIARKVRRETPLGQSSVSMANLVREDIDAHTAGRRDAAIALIGVGAMTVTLAEYLTEREYSNLWFVNRTASKAQALAEQHHGRSMSLMEFRETPPPVDVVFTATGSTEAIFDAAMVKKLASQSRDLLMIDLALPRDIDSSIIVPSNTQVLDIAHFRTRAELNTRERFRAVDAAERIIEAAISRAHVQNARREFQPVMAAAMNEGLAHAESGLRRLFDNELAHLAESDRATITEWVKQLVLYTNRLPINALSAQADFTRDDCNSDVGSEPVEEDETYKSTGDVAQPHSRQNQHVDDQ